MAYTFTPISTNTLSTTAATVTLTIPNGYSDYRVHILAKSNGAVGASSFTMTCSNNWNASYALGTSNASTGTTTANNTATALTITLPSSNNGSNVTNNFASAVIEFQNLTKRISIGTVSGFFFSGASNQSSGATIPATNAWGNIQGSGVAVNSIVLTPASGSFIAGCRFDIYGILSA